MALWAKGYGGPADQEGNAVGVDGSGNIYVGGYSNEAINFGCGVLAAGAGESPALFKLDPSGNCLWSKLFASGSGTANSVNDLGVDSAGNVYISVTFNGAIDLGAGMMTTAGNYDIAVAKYDTNGNYQWANQYGDASLQIGYGLAVDPSGDVILGGTFAGTINFGGGSITSPNGEDTAFLAKLTTAGAYVWAHAYGSGGLQIVYKVASDPSGDVLATGANLGSVNFGCGALTASAGALDAFVVKLTPAGACAWSDEYEDSSGAANDVIGNGIGSDAQGNVLATGYYGGTVDFGGATWTSVDSEDAWVLKLGPTGSYVWSRVIGGPMEQRGSAITADASGNVLVAGEFYGSADFGGGTLTSAGSSDAFVAKYDATNGYVWAYLYGDAYFQTAKAVRTDAAGDVIVVGTAGATGGAVGTGFINFGTGQICGYGGEDIFVAKLGP